MSRAERVVKRLRLALRRVREGSPSASFWTRAWGAYLERRVWGA